MTIFKLNGFSILPQAPLEGQFASDFFRQVPNRAKKPLLSQ